MIVLYILLYFWIGIAVNHLYKRRDSRKTVMVDDVILKKVHYDRALYIQKEFDALAAAGYCFWRRKLPFCHFTFRTNNVIGLIFWPIDLILSEIGYKMEFAYLEKGE